MLADPAVFSAPLEATVRAELEASGLLRDTLTQEKNLVFRALQTALETASQSSRLAQALGVGRLMDFGHDSCASFTLVQTEISQKIFSLS